MQLRRASLPIAVSLAVASLAVAAGPYFPPPDSQGGWRTLKDRDSVLKSTGIDLGRLDQAFECAQRSSQHGGLLVVRHGYLVYEKYYGKGSRMANPTMASVGKAYVSIASGIMLAEFKDKFPEGLDTKVFNERYLPEALPLDDPAKAEIRLGHLLGMGAGLRGDGVNAGLVNGEPSVKFDSAPRPAAPISQDMAALRIPMWTNPGGGYSYASGSPHVASIVLRHVTGKEVRDYLDDKLAKPMGWGTWGWQNHQGATPLDHNPGGGGVAVHASDALRFRYLLLPRDA